MHVALVTGANHGIGAATAEAPAAAGCSVLCAYWVVEDGPDPAVPDAYRIGRARTADPVVDGIRERGGRAEAIAEDLTDADAARRLFDHAEKTLGPVDILVNNASGWVQDIFSAARTDHGLRRGCADQRKRHHPAVSMLRWWRPRCGTPATVTSASRTRCWAAPARTCCSCRASSPISTWPGRSRSWRASCAGWPGSAG
ncbi:MAG: SDR family NAD(P)-dependent oxidoreductase [Actinoplanes sp.]